MGVATYYFSYVCNNAGMLSAFMISASVAEVVGLLIFPKVTKVLSRKKAFLMACVLPPIGLILLLIVGIACPNNIALTAVAGVIVKTGTGLELGCATVFLADVVDYGEYVLGTRNEGSGILFTDTDRKTDRSIYFIGNQICTGTYRICTECSTVAGNTEFYPCTDVYRTDNRSHSGIHRI